MKNNKSKPVIKVNNSGYNVTYTEDVFKKNLDKIASVFKSSQATKSLEANKNVIRNQNQTTAEN